MRGTVFVTAAAIIVVVVAIGVAQSCSVSSSAPRAGDPGSPDRDATQPREPLRGMLLGQPLGNSGAALPPGGRHPCATDASQAMARLEQFFSVVRQPVLTPDEQRFRDEQGWPPLVRTRYLPETIAAAAVTWEPLLFRVELPADPDVLSEEDARRYPFIRTWYVLDCAALEYLNAGYGGFVSRRGAYPFDDIAPEHLEVVEVPAGQDGRRLMLTLLRDEYANRLKLARTARPIESAGELEEVVDLLYRVGRLALSGFNSRAELVGRGAVELPEVIAVEDTVHWTVYDDAIVPGQPPSPPNEFTVMHVILYDRATRQLVQHTFREDEPERDRPYAAIRLPGDGATFRRTGSRSVGLSGSARHGRQILSPDRMEWVSDHDGAIAQGLGARLRARDLTPGRHEITFRACDDAGRCDSDSRTIVIE